MFPRGKRKLSLYFPDFLLRQLEAEAQRLDRPLSWLIQRAWRIGYRQIQEERQAKEAARVPRFALAATPSSRAS
jgi:uncharacterized small protein (TIGR04563 family)